MKALRVKQGHTASHAGAFFGPGWVEEMADLEAAAALATGDWEEVDLGRKTQQERPEGDALIEAIRGQFAGLGADDFGKDGTPLVKPLEDALGYDITAEERDQAWAVHQAAQS